MPLQFKRKRPASGFRGQGSAKRFQGGSGSHFRPARSWRGGANRGSFSNRRTASQVIIRQPTSLPDRLYVKLRYRENLAFNQTLGALADNVYRGNSLNDPDLTGTGGQPLGFDQWAAFYASYTVLGSKIEVTTMNSDGTANVPNTRFGITPTLFSTVFATTAQEQAEELPYAIARSNTMGAQGIGQGYAKQYMSTAKIWGVVRPAVQIEDGYSALTNASPSDQWFWHVWNYVPSGATQNLQVIVKITYFAVFEVRQQLALS